jgi:hypothetical protein
MISLGECVFAMRVSIHDTMSRAQLGGRERPFVGLGSQTRFYRVPLDVRNDTVEFLFITDEVLEGFVLPERAGSTRQSVARQGGMRLESVHDPLARRVPRAGVTQRFNPRRERLKDPMEMTRHDGEGEEFVALVREMKHRAHDESGESRVLEVSDVERRIELSVGARERQLLAIGLPLDFRHSRRALAAL